MTDIGKKQPAMRQLGVTIRLCSALAEPELLANATIASERLTATSANNASSPNIMPKETPMLKWKTTRMKKSATAICAAMTIRFTIMFEVTYTFAEIGDEMI